MVILDKIDFGYKKESPLFSQLSLELTQGKIYGLLGLNGAGKTTLFKLISGLLNPKTGTCKVYDRISFKRHPEFLENIYFLTDEFYLPDLTVSKFVNLYKSFYSLFSGQLFESCLQEFGIDQKDKLKSMSYGQKKKVLISFGIATNTKLLLLDEPTNGLDIPSKTAFRKILASYASEEKCIVISTHQVRDLEMMLDHFLIIEDGKMLVNVSSMDISKKLLFRRIQDSDQHENILYKENSVKGDIGIIKNTRSEDSKVDIELFFNGAIAQKQVFNELLS
jgi:ABC-2 type transport system ATP-binding protein